MEFKERYISAAEFQTSPADKRVVLSNDAYSIGEMINELIKKLESLRINL